MDGSFSSERLDDLAEMALEDDSLDEETGVIFEDSEVECVLLNYYFVQLYLVFTGMGILKSGILFFHQTWSHPSHDIASSFLQISL